MRSINEVLAHENYTFSHAINAYTRQTMTSEYIYFSNC